ncbi:hypothetical protein ATZ36_02245 [Candidatus Endomicrobiellum trichonymphae]|uniref:Uncharacterized protein n=1 Tax=Endomicrobium trichonymphae TaxID=1408204 RepID=A0A1E5IGE5_ENDTX|nr:hypothetical protein ATZ36_02245 [Candidatus Endomicrobium trichonymphae]
MKYVIKNLMLLKIANSAEYEVLSGNVNCGLNGLICPRYAVLNNNLPFEKTKTNSGLFPY